MMNLYTILMIIFSLISGFGAVIAPIAVMFWSRNMEEVLYACLAGFLLINWGGMAFLDHFLSKVHFTVWHYVASTVVYGIGGVVAILFLRK